MRRLARLGNLQFAICILHFAIAAPLLAQDPSSLASREEAALRAAADRVAPSVVQIRTIGGLEVVEGQLVNDGPTTGLVISPDGYILSSAFNFAQQPSSILVTFASGKQASAELVATDHSRMTVLLKAAGMAELPVPEFAPPAEARPGQWAVAMGRTFRADRTNLVPNDIERIDAGIFDRVSERVVRVLAIAAGFGQLHLARAERRTAFIHFDVAPKRPMIGKSRRSLSQTG